MCSRMYRIVILVSHILSLTSVLFLRISRCGKELRHLSATFYRNTEVSVWFFAAGVRKSRAGNRIV
jgi:hypothetical protein